MKISEMEVALRYHNGSDLQVVNAARVSFGKVSNELNEKDERLINYLAKHNHWTPFGHVGATLYFKAPLFVARQLGKHQVGFVWNEVSRRYVDDEPEFWFPKEWRGKPINAKQGSDGILEKEPIQAIIEDSYYGYDGTPYNITEMCLSIYNSMLQLGVAPEQARMILPQNMMTEWIWTGSLAAWARVIKLRSDPHAQYECQLIAQQITNIMQDLFPVSTKALLET